MWTLSQQWIVAAHRILFISITKQLQGNINSCKKEAETKSKWHTCTHSL